MRGGTGAGPGVVIVGSDQRRWQPSQGGEEGWTQNTGGPALSSAHLSQSRPPQSHCLIWLGVPEPFLPPGTVLLGLLVSRVTRTVVLIVSLVQNGVCESVPSSPGLYGPESLPPRPTEGSLESCECAGANVPVLRKNNQGRDWPVAPASVCGPTYFPTQTPPNQGPALRSPHPVPPPWHELALPTVPSPSSFCHLSWTRGSGPLVGSEVSGRKEARSALEYSTCIPSWLGGCSPPSSHHLLLFVASGLAFSCAPQTQASLWG